MKQFVCVRLVKANSLDLSLFQFDYDLTFAAFFLNADRTIYGRFGTRSNQKADLDISLDGFAKALRGALDLHRGYPGNRASLAGKQPGPPRFPIPEDYPLLRGKYRADLDYSGKVAQSCIHCHQVGEAERMVFRGQSKPIPDAVLFPWPMPETLGLELDPKEAALVRKVRPDSPAARAGFQASDAIVSIQGQPILSVADVQWALHHAPEGEVLGVAVARGNKEASLRLALEKGWRDRSDLSWRPTSWDLRRMATGGMLLEDLSDTDRKAAGLGTDKLALRIKHLGEYGEHATAKKAGILPKDVIVSWDGSTARRSESELIAATVRARAPGASIPVTVLRDGQRKEFQLLIR